MIRELKTFVAVAREGTFAAAGERVGLTQAAVSAQMQRLEAELGFALFDRSGRAARLNAIGQQTLARAQELIRLYEGLASPEPGPAPRAVVRIGAIASVQRSVLPAVLAQFHRQYRDCRTQVLPGLSIDLLDRVDSGEIDMAAIIRPPFTLQSELRWTTLAREPFRMLVPRAVRDDDWAELLSTQPFVRYDRSSYGGRQVDRFLRDAHMAVREVCEVDELDVIVRLVAQGVGVALVPQPVTQRRWPAAVRVIDLGPRSFHREIGLVHRGSRASSEEARMLTEMVRGAYAAVGST